MWTATGLSSVGDGMVFVGFPLLALSYTHQAVLIAGVAVAGQAPALLVALPAGALADRVNRRRLLTAVELARFVILAAFATLVVTHHSSLAVLYVSAFAIGSLGITFECASGACLPELVKPHHLIKANTRLASADLTGREVVGQAIGGIAFAISRFVPFAADAASFLLSAGLLSSSIPDNPPSAAEPTAFWADIRDGLRWFAGQPLMRLLAGLVAQLAFCQAFVLGLLVLYATQDLHLSKAGYGLLLAISAIASVVGASAAGQVHARLGSGWCIIAAGGCAAAAYCVLAATRSPVVACGALALESLALMVGLVASRSLRQANVPPELQGRVMSAYQMLVYAAYPLGALAAGLLADGLGVRATFLIAGCLQAVVIVAAAPRLLDRIRAQDRQSRASARRAGEPAALAAKSDPASEPEAAVA
jgi:MFS family permease